MYRNIPDELKELNQWCCCGLDKIPLNPKTGKRASPTNPNTWGTFVEAVDAHKIGIGFVLTPQDPYCVIDLDHTDDLQITNRQNRIIEAFDSYTERSLSGKGSHIVLKGSVPSGARRDKVEIYSQDRFIIFTGNVTRKKPIFLNQPLIDQLYSEMGATKVIQHLEETDEETHSDLTIVEMGMYAANADKFNSLCQGRWEGEYPSQSEADLALLSILAFYSRNNNQVRRLFRMSALGQRDKAQKNDTYIDYALKRIRANQVAEIEASALPTRVERKAVNKIIFPPGLVGEIATYIYQNATRPVPEVALIAALALLGGIAGRSYNISGTGLNQYLILLAPTGTGKEGATQGIDQLIQAVRLKIPVVDQFIGPSAFASGQALIRILEDKPSFVSVLGEFGLTLQQISHPKANSAEIMLKKVLLDLYNKSGHNRVLQANVYSQAEKNTKLVRSPNVTILGEGTPTSFYEGLNEDLVSQGLIPRFTIIEYTGPRPPRNPSANFPPPESLVEKLTQYTAIALQIQAQNQVYPVLMDGGAQALLDQFDLECDAKINDCHSEAITQIWNRAHLKALKLAALLATGINASAPLITTPVAQWCLDLVHRDVSGLEEKFATGLLGKSANGGATENQQEESIRRWVELYHELGVKGREQYRVPLKLITTSYVPYVYLRRRARLSSPFQKDLRGITKALDETLKDMVLAGVLNKVDPLKALTEFETKVPIYSVGPSW